MNDSAPLPQQLFLSSGDGATRDSVEFSCSMRTCEYHGLVPKDAVQPVFLEFWNYGIRRSTVELALSKDIYSIPQQSSPTRLAREQLAGLLIRRLDSLNRIDSSYAPLDHDGIRQAFADALATDDSLFVEAYPDSLPIGLDTNGLVDLTFKSALRRQGSLAQIVASWGLPLDYDQALPLVLAYIRKNALPGDDSARLFPPASLRLKSPLALAELPVPGGRTVALSGRFECDSGLARIRTTITKGSDTANRLFIVPASSIPPGAKSVDLSDDLSITAKNGTPFGTYTLLVQVEDSKGTTLKSSLVFQVVAPPDDKGPSIVLIGPRQETVLASDDSVVEIRAFASDPSGVDSIRIDGRVPTMSGDTAILKVRIPGTGKITSLSVRAWDRAGNATDSTLRLWRPDPTGQLTPSMAILSPMRRDTIVLPEDSSSIRIVVSASSPYGVPDSGVLIDKMVAERTSSTTWQRIIPVAATGIKTTIAIEMRDNHGNRVPEFLDVLRRKDSLGPSLHRIVPAGATTSLEFEQSLAEIRFEARDPSGLDSIFLEIRSPTGASRSYPQRLSGNLFFATIQIPATGDTVQVHLVARDSLGNKTDSVMKYLRRASPRETMFPIVLLSPATRLGNLLPKGVDSFRVSWRLRSPNGIAWNPIQTGSKQIDTSKSEPIYDNTRGSGFCTGHLERTDDSTATCVAKIPEGGPYALSIFALDKGGKLAVTDTVYVSRATTAPSVRLEWIPPKGLDTLAGTKTLPVRFDSVELSWKLPGDCPDCSTKIDGAKTKIDETTKETRRKIELPVGLSRHEIQVWYRDAIIAFDTLTLRRIPKPVVERTNPVSDTLDSTASRVDASWSVRHASRILVDGRPVEFPEGTFSISLNPAREGANRTVIVAYDSLGTPDTTISVLYKLRSTDLQVRRLDPTKTTFWDVAWYAISSADSGARYEWSLDGATWKTISGDSLGLDRTGRPRVRATAPGRLPTVLTADSVQIRHTNKAPSYKYKLSDTIFVDEDAGESRLNFASGISVGDAWDSLQRPSFKVTVLGTDSLFDKLPSIDAGTGMLTFSTRQNATGLGRIRVVLRDNGGSGSNENWGVDSTIPDTVFVRARPVNDIPTLSPFPAISVPLVPGRGFAFKLPDNSVGGGPDEAAEGQFLVYSFEAFGESPARCDIGINATRDSFLVTPRAGRGGTVSFKVKVRDSIPGPKGNQGGKTTEEFKSLEFGPLLLQVDIVDSLVDTSGQSIGFVPIGGTAWTTANIGARSFGRDSTGFAPTSLDDAKICPSGWRLPTQADWKRLVDTVAGGQLAAKKDSIGAYRLRWTAGYADSSGQPYNGSNSSGMALVANSTNAKGLTFARFWTAEGTMATFQNSPAFEVSTQEPGTPASVRCVLD